MNISVNYRGILSNSVLLFCENAAECPALWAGSFTSIEMFNSVTLGLS